MNGQPDGADIVVGAERINALTIDLSRVIIKMLLHVKHVVTKGGSATASNT